MPSVRRIVLATFAAWHGLAAVKNVCELLGTFAVVPSAERFGSKNLPAMEKLLASLHPSLEVLGVLLTGVIGLQTSVAVAFVRGDEERAFALAFLLFSAFVLIDDAFVDYRLDETHRGILTLLLVGYLVVRREGREGR